jgi:hypothetical protein
MPGLLRSEQVAGFNRNRWLQSSECATSPAEGQINRLKMLKRTMYGRVGFRLLRTRVLHAHNATTARNLRENPKFDSIAIVGTFEAFASNPADPFRIPFTVSAGLGRCVRFERAGSRCQGCGRPHLAQDPLSDKRAVFDETARIAWPSGSLARPDRHSHVRLTRVVLRAAHLDNNPANNQLANLRSFCQRCHMLHDRMTSHSTWRSAG